MCGRFAQVYDDSALIKKFRLEDISNRIQPKFNLSPGNQVNAILFRENSLKLKPLLWGFSELHGKPLPSLIFNSRLDTLLSDSHLGKYLVMHRCIIPVSGFYEWHKKQPYYIKKSSSDILCIAGVFIPDEDGYKCSVTTIDSTGFLKNIHHRMPLILDERTIDIWLNNPVPDETSILKSIENYIDSLDFYKVTSAVNDTNFESEECIKPLKENLLF
ncbi:MAG: SOS response-associated peptidase [Candidatus Delongbacteria bacterium]|nr:SOS response-associated peptidase [Candidatus Delongbacteria bacterium]